MEKGKAIGALGALRWRRKIKPLPRLKKMNELKIKEKTELSRAVSVGKSEVMK